jgi:hypothetical protein
MSVNLDVLLKKSLRYNAKIGEIGIDELIR